MKHKNNFLLALLLIFSIQANAQQSTCQCSDTQLVCTTPASYTFPSSDGVYDTGYKPVTTSVKGIAFTPSSIEMTSQCHCGNSFDKNCKYDPPHLGKSMVYVNRRDNSNGHKDRYYCFFNNQVICDQTTFQGTFSTAQHEHLSVVLSPPKLNGEYLPSGQYTQSMNCPASDLPNGYLLIDRQGKNEYLEMPSQGLLTNGILFVPETSTEYAEIKGVMDSYNSGKTTIVSNAFMSYVMGANKLEFKCGSTQTGSILPVKTSKVPQCQVTTYMNQSSKMACFQMKPCSSLKGHQGHYTYDDNQVTLNLDSVGCTLGGIELGKNATVSNTTDLYYDLGKSCSFAFDPTIGYGKDLKKTCHFQINNLVIGNGTGIDIDKGGVSFSLFDGFFDWLLWIGAGVSLIILIVLCVCLQKNSKNRELVETPRPISAENCNLSKFTIIAGRTGFVVPGLFFVNSFGLILLMILVNDLTPVQSIFTWYFLAISLLYGSLSMTLTIQGKSDIDLTIAILFVLGSWSQILNEYWILWVAIMVSAYPTVIIHRKMYSNQTYSIAILVSSFFFGGISLYLTKECEFGNQLSSLILLSVLTLIIVMMITAEEGPFDGSLFTIVSYAIILFTVNGVADGCDEPMISLMSLFGVASLSILAVYSFVPKKKKGENSLEAQQAQDERSVERVETEANLVNEDPGVTRANALEENADLSAANYNIMIAEG